METKSMQPKIQWGIVEMSTTQKITPEDNRLPEPMHQIEYTNAWGEFRAN